MVSFPADFLRHVVFVSITTFSVLSGGGKANTCLLDLVTFAPTQGPTEQPVLVDTGSTPPVGGSENDVSPGRGNTNTNTVMIFLMLIFVGIL